MNDGTTTKGFGSSAAYGVNHGGSAGNAEKDSALEPGWERIALFTIDNEVKHAARQLPSGTWTSKMGAEDWMKSRADCFTCHAVKLKNVGPAYIDVAKKYAGASDAQVKTLVQKVKLGGAGNWGTVPMAAHPSASDEMLEKAVRWVLSQK